ncbi:MAG: molybdenum cofactor biosynthesis protein [Candidatus Binatia bacterium]|nr:MAG: molybdenum cofactor biosynthesis protein [Candidatus Binatia bacterium]
MPNVSAAIVVIGNEILSGKVEDTNSSFLAKELRSLGVSLERILVIPDDVEVIAESIRDYSTRFDWVFTSGGVGPTHDDVTVAGVARALGVEVVRHPVLEKLLLAYSAGKPDKASLKLAEVPEGAELIYGEDLAFPVLKARNILILPGIPELFRAKFKALRSRFVSAPFYLRVIYLRAAETTLVPYLNATLQAFPELLLGSYPKWNDPEYRVRVTLESKDQRYVDQALAHLLAQIPPELVVRTE